MSGRFSVDINDLYGGTPTETKTETKKVVKKEVKKETKPVVTKDYTRANGVNKKNNYTITFKIDADVEDFLKHIEWIKILETRESTNKNQYVNDLIRQDMLKLLKLKPNAKIEDIQKEWENYKKANNI